MFVPCVIRPKQSGDVTRIWTDPLCYYAVFFAQTRNGYVATHFVLLSSTAESSATSGYVVVAERFGKIKNQLAKVINGLEKAWYWSQRWIEAMQYKNRCEHDFYPFFDEFCFLYFSFIGAFFSIFRLWKISLIFCLCYSLLCRRGNSYFDILFWRIKPVLFAAERWKGRGLWKKKWTEGFFFSQNWLSFCIFDIIKVLFPICMLNWRVNNYVYCRGKGIKKINGRTFIVI